MQRERLPLLIQSLAANRGKTRPVGEGGGKHIFAQAAVNDYRFCHLCGLKDLHLVTSGKIRRRKNEGKKNTEENLPWMFSQLDN